MDNYFYQAANNIIFRKPNGTERLTICEFTFYYTKHIKSKERNRRNKTSSPLFYVSIIEIDIDFAESLLDTHHQNTH